MAEPWRNGYPLARLPAARSSSKRSVAGPRCRPRLRAHPTLRCNGGSSGTATRSSRSRTATRGANVMPPSAATIANRACRLRISTRGRSAIPRSAASRSICARRPCPGIENSNASEANASARGAFPARAQRWLRGVANSTGSSNNGCTSSLPSSSGSTTIARSARSESNRATESSVPSISTLTRSPGIRSLNRATAPGSSQSVTVSVAHKAIRCSPDASPPVIVRTVASRSSTRRPAHSASAMPASVGTTRRPTR